MKRVGQGPDMPRIEAVWAFLAVDADGDEGVCAFQGPTGWMPMVAADRKRVELLRPVARQMAADGSVVIKLCRFSVREELETFTSKANGE